ncbi:MAG: M20/M25/M40 family metallo-hydrolase, partial [Duncaniella sp.]|nr:M20/M25/M40 family metallo-hydrolase [Duncaniella sp.]
MTPVSLLQALIATPSQSRHEDATADILFDEMSARGLQPSRIANNVYAVAPGYDPSRPTLLLNSHHDTVPPSKSYTRDPYKPTLTEGRLYGLGSNDAGASGVALLEAFTRVRNQQLPFNLIIALTAEEEVGGENGMRLFLPHILGEGYRIDAAIVGEPTGMQAAVGERGLVVFD